MPKFKVSFTKKMKNFINLNFLSICTINYNKKVLI